MYCFLEEGLLSLVALGTQLELHSNNFVRHPLEECSLRVVVASGILCLVP